MTTATNHLTDLYLDDETAWLEAMAERIQAGVYDELDYAHLQEYLSDMAKRDRREVRSRLVVLLTHLLKWIAQPERRTRSWVTTIIEQQQDLLDAAETGVLRNHAEAVLADAYANAIKRTCAETGLLADAFPAACPYTFAELLAFHPDLQEN